VFEKLNYDAAFLRFSEKQEKYEPDYLSKDNRFKSDLIKSFIPKKIDKVNY